MAAERDSEYNRSGLDLEYATRPLIDVGTNGDRTAPFDYRNASPPTESHAFQKQSAKRHFGVHGYFTKQVWSVVQSYIGQLTQPGDVVLDPFGGSGVTAIEALVIGRNAIHVDLNPLPNFIVETLLMPVDFETLELRFNEVLRGFTQQRPQSALDVERILDTYSYPKNVQLPRNSDVTVVSELFSKKQLAELALLKHIIKQTSDTAVRCHLLLMFSGLLNKINLTYHASAGRSEGRGDSSMFRYYRYRLAHESPDLEITKVLQSRLKKVLAAKYELLPVTSRTMGTTGDVRSGSATDLFWIEDESVDYIYTDPPYGSKIPYLDLSTMWNAWLDLPVTRQDHTLEVIEGGEARKSRADYSELLAQSIHEMYRVLKSDHWLSFAFSHSDPALWSFIVNTAERFGFEYVSVTRQNNGQSSFKKRQHPFSVLTGQLILNFRKGRSKRAVRATNRQMDTHKVILATITSVIEQSDGATIEQINDALVIFGLESGLLETLSQRYSDLALILRKNFAFDKDGRWRLM